MLSKKARIVYEVDSRSGVRGANAMAGATESVRKAAIESTEAIRDFDRALARTNKNQQLIAQVSGSASDGIGSLASSFGGLAGSLATPAGAIAALVGTAAAIGEVSSKALELAERSAQLTAVFENVPIPIEAARRQTRGLITDFDLARLASDSVNLGITDNAKKFADLSEALQKLGARRGIDALKSIEDGFSAIGRGSTELLDNLGITLKAAEAQEEYAKSLGKSVKELSNAEKAEAFREVATRKVIEAARGVTLDTDNASAAVRRFNIELQNIEDRALGGEVATLSLAEGLRQVSSEQTIDTKALRSYGGAVADLRTQLRDLGVASVDIPASIEALAKAAENANVEISRLNGLEELRRQAQERDPEFRRAQQRAEAERLSVENAKERLVEIEEEQAFLAANNKAIAQKAELQIETLQLQSLIARAAGDEAKANQLARAAELAQLRELGRIANEGGRRRGRGRRRDPFAAERAAFQQLLDIQKQAEATAAFVASADRQRNADRAAFNEELNRTLSLQAIEGDRLRAANDALQRRSELQQADLERQIQLAEVLGNPAEAFALEQQQFAIREENLRRRIELETEVGERERIQDELAQVRHERTISRLQEEQRQREETNAAIAAAISSVSTVERGAFQLSGTIAAATIQGEQRKKRVLDGIKAAGLFSDGAVASAQAAIAYASGNIPQGIALTAAAANAFAQGAVVAAGNARGGGGGGGAGTSAGAALGRGAPVERAQFSVDRGAPLSVREEVEGNPNNTGNSSNLNNGATVQNVTINAGGTIDRAAAKNIIREIQRFDGRPT